MPPPKDPEKLKEYREKMRRIALERGYGKWMKGKARTLESIEKTRQANVGKTISEKHRAALRVARQKEIGEGKELFGGEAGKEKRVASVRAQRKGKTYEDIYGIERAKEEARKRRQGNVGSHAGRSAHPNRGSGSRERSGKTYAEIYGPKRAEEEDGPKRAEEEARKRSEAHKALHPPKEADPSRRAKHNADRRYVEWRTAVFARDDYTCQSCGLWGGKLQAHHVKLWADYPALRHEVSNGLTVCQPCHRALHAPL